MKHLLPLFLVAAAVADAAEASLDPYRGLYAIWLKPGQVADGVGIVGEQVVAQWKDVEPEPGRYDFSIIQRQLAQQQRLGHFCTIQINGNQHPNWLFNRIPSIAEAVSGQVRDPQGTLAYWHPAYAAAYRDLLAAFGAYLKKSPLRASVAGVRLNFNAIGTEHFDVPARWQEPSLWRIPAGAAAAERWSAAVVGPYQRMVVDAYAKALLPEVRVLAQTNLFTGPQTQEAEWARLLELGQLGLFHTSSGMEPRTEGVREYEALLRYCRGGKTVCYAEPWADAWGRHGGTADARWASPEQSFYWRLLADLHCGVSQIALYGTDLEHAGEPEFRDALQFAARYAGYHATPTEAPGAWVALREGNTLKGDYTYLMQRAGDEMKPAKPASPKEQRFGAWARVLMGSAWFDLDGSFARSLAGKAAAVTVTYLDEGEGSFTVEAGGERLGVLKGNTKRWRQVRISVERFSGTWVRVSSESAVTLHMVEVERVRR